MGGGTFRTKQIKESVTVFIFGLGHIGRVLASKCKSMDWTVYGIKRDCCQAISNVDFVLPFEKALETLSVADYVVNLLPETPETTGVYDMSFFRRMKKDAVFCNVGRKSAVIDKDLCEAVENNIIMGAILDVHTEYNYANPNILLTQHTSYLSEDNDKRINEFYSEQLMSYIESRNN